LEKFLVCFRSQRQDGCELKILQRVRGLAHADERRYYAWRRARELDGALRIGREAGEFFRKLRRQIARKPGLQE
jgi:hypothetical protein